MEDLEWVGEKERERLRNWEKFMAELILSENLKYMASMFCASFLPERKWHFRFPGMLEPHAKKDGQICHSEFMKDIFFFSLTKKNKSNTRFPILKISRLWRAN